MFLPQAAPRVASFSKERPHRLRSMTHVKKKQVCLISALGIQAAADEFKNQVKPKVFFWCMQPIMFTGILA